MAFFLDPELAALAEGNAPRTVTAKIVPNKFAKLCDKGCGHRVDAGTGRLEKAAGAWRVYHLAC
jgi:hypothetical protein